MTKQDLINNKYKQLQEKKCGNCFFKCDLTEQIKQLRVISLQDLYMLDNCKSYKRG